MTDLCMRIWIGLFIIILGISTLFLLNENLIFYSVILLSIAFITTILITIYELFCSFHDNQNTDDERNENNEIVVEGDYLY